MKFNLKNLFTKTKSFETGSPIFINNMFRSNGYQKLAPHQVKSALHGVVSNCIDKRANNAAKSLPVIYRDVAGFDTRKNRPIENHPFIDLLNCPNPFQSRFGIMFQTVSNLDAWGNAYWYVPKNALGVPYQIRLLNPLNVKYILDENYYPIGFKRIYYTNNTKKEEYYSLDEILHFKYEDYDVESLYGLSIIQKAYKEIELHGIESDYQKYYLENGGQPSLIFETNETLKPAQKEQYKASFEQQNTGATKAGKTIILDGGMKARPYSINPAELSYLESIKATRDNILAMFSVPIGMFYVENVNKANNESGINNFLKNTVSDIITQIDATLTNYIKKTYNKKFYLEHKLPYDYTRQEQFKEITEIAKLGAVSMNELRNFSNLDPDSYLEKEENKYYNIKFSTNNTNNQSSDSNNNKDQQQES